jgi:hypothetical protein
MSNERRDTLKIIGAIGATCAFPFAADELYGQHQDPAHRHHTPGQQASTGPIRFFTPVELATLAAVANQIIPDSDTPGAVKAGVPGYIDLVVATNPGHQRLFREGLAWLEMQAQERHQLAFAEISGAQQLALLRPLCEASDRGEARSVGEQFFATAKSMTCDGYYTSRAGMVEELGFAGAAVLAEYQSCAIPEH